jgi:hypothetical protein
VLRGARAGETLLRCVRRMAHVAEMFDGDLYLYALSSNHYPLMTRLLALATLVHLSINTMTYNMAYSSSRETRSATQEPIFHHAYAHGRRSLEGRGAVICVTVS